MGEDGKVSRAMFHVNEFRGFENSRRPHGFRDAVYHPCICGICPVTTPHPPRLAISSWLPAPSPCLIAARLMHMGQIVQSHGMHFFEQFVPIFSSVLTRTGRAMCSGWQR
jgi:NAD-reducing hydrogenase large subunit